MLVDEAGGVDAEWEYTPSEGPQLVLKSAAHMPDGGYALAGSGSGAWLVTTDVFGGELSRRHYGEELHDGFLAMAALPGGFAFAGKRRQPEPGPTGPLDDGWLVLTSTNGDVLIDVTFEDHQ